MILNITDAIFIQFSKLLFGFGKNLERINISKRLISL
jgi:hypothetical protein